MWWIAGWGVLNDSLGFQSRAPANAFLNDKGDILFITWRTGKYMEHSAGKTNHNIYAMAREGLREALANVFRKARELNIGRFTEAVTTSSNCATLANTDRSFRHCQV
jgi:hypothetical protein